MYVVSTGDPFNGLTLYGPFESHEQALDWAEGELNHREYTIVCLQKPMFLDDYKQMG